jgi:phosphatidate cytidylyltransferase
MSKNLKKRIYTSLGLILLLILMFINNYATSYFLIVIGVFSILEFLKIILIVFNKKKIIQIFINLIFILFIFIFCFIFLFFSFYAHLKILLFIILITCIFSDIGGFVFGKIFKGAKLTKISPKKTISGALGSLILSSAFILLAIYYFTNTFDLLILLVGIVTSVSCQFGDLLFSFLKRKSLLKDTGNLLPGHGGILDRIDGILFGMPIGLITLLIIY